MIFLPCLLTGLLLLPSVLLPFRVASDDLACFVVLPLHLDISDNKGYMGDESSCAATTWLLAGAHSSCDEMVLQAHLLRRHRPLSSQRLLLRLLLELLELGSLLLEQAYDPLELGGIVHLVRICCISFH